MRKWMQTALATTALALPLLITGTVASGGVGPQPPIDKRPSPAIPEPGAIAIFALGAATVGFAVRKGLRR